MTLEELVWRQDLRSIRDVKESSALNDKLFTIAANLKSNLKQKAHSTRAFFNKLQSVRLAHAGTRGSFH